MQVTKNDKNQYVIVVENNEDHFLLTYILQEYVQQFELEEYPQTDFAANLLASLYK